MNKNFFLKWSDQYKMKVKEKLLAESKRNLDIMILWIKFKYCMYYLELIAFVLALQTSFFMIIAEDSILNPNYIIFFLSIIIIYICWTRIRIIVDIWENEKIDGIENSHYFGFIEPYYWGKRREISGIEKGSKKWNMLTVGQIIVFILSIILVHNYVIEKVAFKAVISYPIGLICIISVYFGAVIIGYGIQNILAAWKGIYWGHMVVAGTILVGIMNIFYGLQILIYLSN